MKSKTLIFLTALVLSLQVSTAVAFAEKNDQAPAAGSTLQKDIANLPKVVKQIVVNRPIAKVWQAIQERRSSDPTHRKLLSYDGKAAVVKEQFTSMPILGSTVCTYVENEVNPQKEIQYYMLNSNHFKAFQGNWKLEPGSKPNTTRVTLTTIIDPGVRIPFWGQIAKASLEKDTNATLSELDQIALSHPNCASDAQQSVH